ncbi:MAG: type II secretion system F family protein [Symbiobacteriaceae bacterium]|nr:type II secretion system F family protein [Symbiobacteriaceae bacterium]
MANFAYTGNNQGGKKVQGVVEAVSAAEAARLLRQEGLFPTHIALRQSWHNLLQRQIVWNRNINLQEVSDFCREAALLLANATPLDRTLQLLAHHRNSPLGEALRRAERSVLQGSSLGQALQREEGIPALLWQSIRSAELSGDLPKVFEELADHYTTEALQESRASAALFYPRLVLLFAVLIVGFILIFLMPSYVDVYTRTDIALPWPTQLLLDISNAMVAYWGIILPLLFALYLLMVRSWRRLRVHPNWEKLELRLPYYGEYLRDRMLAQLSRTLAVLLQVGVPLDLALLSCENLPERRIWRAAVHRVRQQVTVGVAFATAMEATGCFPESYVQLLHVGSESGSLELMLPKSAAYYTHQANVRGEKLLSLLQPVVMLGVAMVVGALAVALLLPLYSQMDLVNNLSNISNVR